jgi:molybdopterin-guanine dinucleotide biosynthesis protein A
MLGAVLAGGESRRFGSDKAAELLAGKPLVVRAAETLARVFADVIVVSSREPVTRAWQHVPDTRESKGPLAGIEAALACAAGRGLEGVFVLACDLPLVDEAAVRTIVGALGERLAAAPMREAPPGVEPLCAIYRVACLPFVADALDREDLAVHDLFEGVSGVKVPLPPDLFLNVNRPGDHRRAAAVLGGGSA